MTQIKQITMQDYSGLKYVGGVSNTFDVGNYRIEEVMAEGKSYTFIIDLDVETVYLIKNGTLQSNGVSADTIRNMILNAV